MKTTVVKLAMAALAVCAVVCTSSCNPENTGESNNDNVPKGVVDIGLSVAADANISVNHIVM